jgi:hypothetical protein
VSSKVIVNDWQDSGQGIRVSRIIDRAVGCEDIDVCRYEAEYGAVLDLAADHGHILSLLDGQAMLEPGEDDLEALYFTSGTHAYIPPGCTARLRFSESSSVIHASASGSRPHGSEFLVHNERYLAPTRFVLTPQYLSRRVFLNRDHTLVSRSGDRVAWFHTTMFDTQGLPPNHDGRSVFKMSYDHQTEVNVVYDVKNQAAVRFAAHPYTEPSAQSWSDWHSLDGNTTYYLNECADGPEIERHTEAVSGKERCLRNRHEIFIAPGGHVSLCCMFDPGPTGLETHQPGEYSAYAPVAAIVGTKEHRDFVASVAPADDIVRSLSLAEARNGGVPDRSSPKWKEYESALNHAKESEEHLIRDSEEERRAIMASWRIE